MIMSDTNTNEQKNLVRENDNNKSESKEQEQPVSKVVAMPYVPLYEYSDDWGVHRRDTCF